MHPSAPKLAPDHGSFCGGRAARIDLRDGRGTASVRPARPPPGIKPGERIAGGPLPGQLVAIEASRDLPLPL
jgi:hypothetical protein